MSKLVKIAIGVVLVVALVVGGVFALSGGDDVPDSADKGSSTSTTGKSPAKTDDGDEDSDAAPALRTFASDRAEGLKASAQADALVRRPKEIWLRVSAAPKQPVTVSYNLTCGAGADALDNFVVTPPNIRKIGPPKKNAKVCPVSAAAQLSGKGRLKIALLRDR